MHDISKYPTQVDPRFISNVWQIKNQNKFFLIQANDKLHHKDQTDFLYQTAKYKIRIHEIDDKDLEILRVQTTCVYEVLSYVPIVLVICISLPGDSETKELLLSLDRER